MLISLKKSDLRWYLILLTTLSVTVYIQYLSKNQYVSVTGFFVPDSYTYELRALQDIKRDAFAANAFNILNQLIYNLGSINFLVFNTSLLILSIWLCKPVFERISKLSVVFARFSIVANPYFLIAAIGPNKEIILLFINMLFWFAYFHKNRIFQKYFLVRKNVLFFVASLPLFIRPYSSFPLYALIFLDKKHFYKPRKLFIIILLSFFLLNSIDFFNNLHSQLIDDSLRSFSDSRIFQIVEILGQYSKDPIMQIPAFAIKSLILLIGPALRSFPIFSDPFPLLDFGYSIIAYILLPVNLSFIVIFMQRQSIKNLCSRITSNDLEASMIFCFTSISLLVTIISPVITFRYIFPVVPFIFAFAQLLGKELFGRIFILSTLFVSIIILFTSNAITIEEGLIPEFMNWL
jgi:hypothetical protein